MSRAACCLALAMTYAVAALSSEEAQSPPAQVVLKQVKFEGAESVPADVRKAIESSLVGQKFEVSEASRDITYIAKRRLVEHGYARAVVAPLDVLHLQGGAIAVTIPIDLGPRYSFGAIQIFDTHVFPASEIEAKFPVAQMRAGDFSGVPAAMQAVRKLYEDEGYIQFYFDPLFPNFSADDEHQTFSFAIKVIEGPQYHVGDVAIVGLDSQQTERVLHSLPPGSNYSREKIEQIAITYGTPLELGVFDIVESRVNWTAQTVDVTLDFTPLLLRF